MSASRQFNTPVNLNSAALAATHNSNTVANVFTTGGNVGIGISTPSNRLHVVGSTTNTGGVIAEFRNSSNGERIQIIDETSTGLPSGIVSPVATFGIGIYGRAGNIRFLTTSSNVERMTITTAGNVGIGTTAPAYTLDVIGTIDATFYTGSNISISGSITSSTLRVTGNADLSTGLTTVTDLTGTNITSGTIRASTLISTSNLSTNNLTSTNLLATASTITNLSIPGTLTVVNITSTNLVETNITAGGIVVTGGSLRATFNSNTIGNIFTTGGNVGINTTSPVGTLDVRDSTNFVGDDAGALYITGGTNGNRRLHMGYHNTNNYGWIEVVEKSVDLKGLSLQPRGGNVGIGTTAPGTPLEVRTGSSTYGIRHSDGTIKLDTYIGGSINGAYFGTVSQHPLGFMTNDSPAQMIIQTNGNVGIGTTAPAYTLDVIGTIDATSYTGTNLGVTNISSGTIRTTTLISTSNLGANTISTGTIRSTNIIGSNMDAIGGNVEDVLLVTTDRENASNRIASFQAGNTGNTLTNDFAYVFVGRTPSVNNGGGLIGFRYGGAQYMSLGLYNTTIGNSQVLTIDGSRNVGIRTTAPTATLDVNGTIDATTYTGSNVSVTNITVGTLRTTTLITTSNLAANNISGGTIRSNTGTITTGNIILTNTIGGGVIQFNDDAHTIYGRMGLNGVIDQMQIREYGQIQFWTGGLLGSQVNRMTIASNGNISMAGAALNNTGFNFPTGGYGIHWQTGSSGVSRIFDDGDLRICTDDNMRFYTGSNASTPGTERITLNSTGVGVYSNSIVSLLCVNGDAGGNGALQVVSVSSSVNSGKSQDGASFKAWNDGNNILQFYNSAGGYRGGVNGSGSGAVTYATSSDRRLKENVINITNATQMIKQMRPVEFTWKSDNRQDFGFIAQEVFELLPSLRPNFTNYSHCECTPEELSHGILCNCEEHDHDEPIDKDGKPLYYGLDYGKFTPYLTKALQETISELEASQQTIQNQESIITQLQSQLAAQQQQINDILTRLG